MKKDVLNYFAYGSNMPAARLRTRCPSARPLGPAVLNGHGLRWHKRSRDGSGKCDIALDLTTAAAVHGVLYQLDASEKTELDRVEGVGHGYEATEVLVLLDGAEHRAMTYRATDIDAALRPYSWYHALVIAGAREHRLPDSYIAFLATVECSEDPDRTRHHKNMILIEGLDA